MDRRMAGAAAGMVALLALVLGGSGAQAASPRPGPAGEPCARTATCAPADLAKLKKQAAEDGAITSDQAKPGAPDKGEVNCATGMREPGDVKKESHSITPEELARALADALGVSLDRATAAARELDRLGRQGGIRPDSAGFAAVAERLGVSPDRLQEAMIAFKRGHAPKDLKPTPGS